MKHLIDLNDLSVEDVEKLFTLAEKLKRELKAGIPHPLLRGKTLGMIFSKSSTRTRVSFEVGMYQLGGYAIFLSSSDIQLGRGETIHDTAKVLSHYVHGIVIRTYKHSDVLDLARYGTIPVINGLTDLMHPCGALDLFTVYETKGRLKGLKLAYVGDGNNVANSLLQVARSPGWTSLWLPAGIRMRRGDNRAGRMPPGSPAAGSYLPKTRKRPSGTQTWCTRTLGQHGPGGRERPAHQAIHALPGQQQAVFARKGRRHVPALPARIQG